MKKLLSLLLAAVMLLSAASAIAPALQASADFYYYKLYAYKGDGTYDLFTGDSEVTPGLVATYDNNESITVGGFRRRVLDLAVSPQFTNNYKALCIEAFGPEIVRLYVNGDVSLTACKMTLGSDTFRAALACSVDIRVYPMSSDAVLRSEYTSSISSGSA